MQTKIFIHIIKQHFTVILIDYHWAVYDNGSLKSHKMYTKNVNKNKYFRSHFQSTFCSHFDCLINAARRLWIFKWPRNVDKKMLIKINILSVIFSLHFVLILIDKVRIAQNYEYFKMVNKYLRYHFQSTFCSYLII